MLKQKALRKILITTFAVFTLFVVYVISNYNEVEELKISPEVSYVTSLGTNDIYLLGKNGYLVRGNVLLNGTTLKQKIESLFNYLIVGKNNHLPEGLSALLPEGTKVLEVQEEENIVTINLSKELWDKTTVTEERMIESIVYSVLSLEGVNGLKLQVEGVPVTTLPGSKKVVPEILTKEYGINKVYELDHSKGIQKVTLYYLNQIKDQEYFVPVTKYMNDSREKIDIIVENLSSNFLYETSLISLLQGNVELMNYQIEDELMLLNFNHNLFNNEKILEEVTYQVAYSIFDTYDVKTVVFEVEGKEFTKIEK